MAYTRLCSDRTDAFDQSDCINPVASITRAHRIIVRVGTIVYAYGDAAIGLLIGIDPMALIQSPASREQRVIVLMLYSWYDRNF